MNRQSVSRALATLALIVELGWIVLSIPLAALVVGLIVGVAIPDDAVRQFPPRAQADCKSGAGCCRPRVQDTEDPKIECNDEDWRK
jgi:hypothetical protein